MDTLHTLHRPPRRPAWLSFHRTRWRLVRIALVVGLGGWLIERHASPDCRATARAASPAITVAVCEREYASTEEPATGLVLAEAYLATCDLVAAHAVANGLLATPARDAARRVLADIAVSARSTCADAPTRPRV
jgi:hypothetical protein